MTPKIKQATPITFQKSGKKGIKISFPFDYATVAQVKQIPGRKFHNEGAEKYWTAPLSLQAIEKLQEFDFSLSPELQKYYDKSKIHVDDMDTDVRIPGLKMDLFPFQKKGVAFIEARNGRALIGDGMRVGKTVQTLAWLQLRQNIRPAVVVCPASVKYGWEAECFKWMKDPNVQVINGTVTDTPITGNIIIINYHILQYWVDELIKIKPALLVLDEIHRIKNKSAKRTKAALKIGKQCDHVLGLSGTFIKNRPEEGYNAIHLIDPSVFPNRWHYLQRYCNAKHNGFGWDFSGASHTTELHKILSNSIMIRRTLEDVMDDMPKVNKRFVRMDLSNRQEYEEAENDFITWLGTKTRKEITEDIKKKLDDDLFESIKMDERKLDSIIKQKTERASNAEALVKMGALERLAAKGKLPHIIEWIEDFLDTGEKLVVMTVNKFVVKELMEKFKGLAVKIDGDLSAKKKKEQEQIFQTDPNIRLMIGNIEAASEGLDFSVANTVAVIQLPWTPGALEQALKRIENVQKTGGVLFHYYLLAKDTIEERKAGVLDKKLKVLDAVLDGKETDTSSLLSELMNHYKED